MNALAPQVLISEVGPRDGLQSIRTVMSTDAKLAWIKALAAAGLREIEVCSFVPPALMPQMADASAVVQSCVHQFGAAASPVIMALVPNLKGAQAAIAAGAQKITVPVSASEAHSLANVRKTRAAMVDEVRSIAAYRAEHAPQVALEVGMSTAFGCTLQGAVDEGEVVQLALDLVTAGVDEVGLSDTTGYANPAQVSRLFSAVFDAIGTRTGAAHLHNTRGLGLANCLAAYHVGVRSFDSSLGGLGGCPYAPGASGNVVTEDLVFMFEAMGIDTGIDLDKLIQARAVLSAALPNETLYGMFPAAGLPKNFTATSHTRI